MRHLNIRQYVLLREERPSNDEGEEVRRDLPYGRSITRRVARSCVGPFWEGCLGIPLPRKKQTGRGEKKPPRGGRDAKGFIPVSMASPGSCRRVGLYRYENAGEEVRTNN